MQSGTCRLLFLLLYVQVPLKGLFSAFAIICLVAQTDPSFGSGVRGGLDSLGASLLRVPIVHLGHGEVEVEGQIIRGVLLIGVIKGLNQTLVCHLVVVEHE